MNRFERARAACMIAGRVYAALCAEAGDRPPSVNVRNLARESVRIVNEVCNVIWPRPPQPGEYVQGPSEPGTDDDARIHDADGLYSP